MSFFLIFIYVNSYNNIGDYLKNKLKLIIYDNSRVIVKEYFILKDIKKEEVIIDNVYIKGKDLLVRRMDDYFIEIVGKIENVSYEE